MTTTECMIKALRAYAVEHKHDIVSTDAVDVSEMCFDAADRLEKLAKGKHGHWMQVGEHDTNDNAYFICSLCKHGDIHAKNAVVNYCWYCGAKMDGDKHGTN